ncbi:helix-turn-helix domain-containing protein [Streptomyces sp. NPDC048192]|uniref:helix-turn-helix domain-containing protein n=1 Tax=Streptomyces sp. NPDC048192 TaxID=3365510 RepID=UPI003717F2A1
MAQAAERLGMSRASVYRKVARYGIEMPDRTIPSRPDGVHHSAGSPHPSPTTGTSAPSRCSRHSGRPTCLNASSRQRRDPSLHVTGLLVGLRSRAVS